MAESEYNFVEIWSKMASKHPEIQEIQFSGEVATEDISDGNVNNVVRLKSKDGNKSVIMKHAPPYIKLYGPSGFPFSVERVEVEYNAMCRFHSICPGCVPRPYCYDKGINAVLMEDLVGFEVMRPALRAEKVDKAAIQAVATAMGQIHQATHVSVLPKEEFQAMIQTYQNEAMVKLTEGHVFTFPYQQDLEGNQTCEALQKTMDRLYNDPALMAAAATLKNIFLTKKECLIHGDMHTGSYMVHKGNAKIIDCEFAMVGAPAFDLGVLIASYIMSYHGHMLTEQDNDRHRQTCYKMLEAARTTVEVYFQQFTATVGSRVQYVSNLISEAAGFAGNELIRRVVRGVHLHDIDGVPGAQIDVLESGLRLLGAYHRIRDIHMLLNIALMLTF